MNRTCGHEQYIDLNSDSSFDVAILHEYSGDASGKDSQIQAYVGGLDIDSSNRVLVDSLYGYHAPLPYGTLISASPDPSLEWGGGRFFTGIVSEWAIYPPYQSEEWSGLLGENGNTYVRVEFVAEESTHYGWINIALGPEDSYGFGTPIVTSWAYEPTPGVGITAGAIPEPSTGILTMVGSISLLLLARARRRGGLASPMFRK